MAFCSLLQKAIFKNLNMKPTLIMAILISTNAFAQKDIIYKKDSTQERCKIVKVTKQQYLFIRVDSLLAISKSSIAKTQVDSVKYNFYDSNLIVHKWLGNLHAPVETDLSIIKQSSWLFTASIGCSLGNLLEFNSPGGTDKKSLSATVTVDLDLNYKNEKKRFSMSNELHSIMAIQKTGFTATDYVQKVSNDINTLHDFSLALGKQRKWNVNLIVKTMLTPFTIYDGDYYKNYTGLGKIQAMLSPYDITVSPGIKWEPDNYLRLSISPYSFNLFGVQNAEIRNKGIYITDMDASGNYKAFLFKRLGAEINIWYDRQIKQWLNLQYRLGISANYFERLANSGLVDGLFITKFKLFRELYLTHRVVLQMDFSNKPLKPFYSQTILLSFTKSF